jgi:hypothetical protein
MIIKIRQNGALESWDLKKEKRWRERERKRQVKKQIWVGEKSIERVSVIYTYIYIYMTVCVCVCVFMSE